MAASGAQSDSNEPPGAEGVRDREAAVEVDDSAYAQLAAQDVLGKLPKDWPAKIVAANTWQVSQTMCMAIVHGAPTLAVHATVAV